MACSCTFQLFLKCSATDTSRSEELTLDAFPATALDVKRRIEGVLSIPASCQAIRYEGTLLADSDVLEAHHIRSGDTLHVSYESEAECADVQKVVAWLVELVAEFQLHLPSQADAIPSPGELLALQTDNVQTLSKDIFYPWESAVKQMNKWYFVNIGGLDVFLEVYRLLLKQSWECMPKALRTLELEILNAIYLLASTFNLRKILIEKGAVEMCSQSLLREKVAEVIQRGLQSPECAILLNCVGLAMSALCNMCEISEAHIKIASSTEALEQLVATSNCSYFSNWSTDMCLSAFVCFAQSPEVHKNLASPEIIKGLIGACQFMKKNSGCNVLDVQLLEYFVQLFLLQIILVSPALICPCSYSVILNHMSKFLAEAEVEVVIERECKKGFIWSVFLPYVKVLFEPKQPAEAPSLQCSHGNEREVEELHVSTFTTLQFLSIESAIFALKCIVSNSDSRKCLLKEGLSEYIMCVPAHVPAVLQSKARELVSMLACHTQLQPPKLSTIAKATLAKMHYGLERMIKLTSVQELFVE